jgi:DNA-binding NtrC family response regulator
VVERKGDQMAMVFTDVGLAGRMDGVALAQSLDAHHPDVPVVVISAQRSRRIDDLPENVIYLASPWRPLDVLIVAARARRAA